MIRLIAPILLLLACVALFVVLGLGAVACVVSGGAAGVAGALGLVAYMLIDCVAIALLKSIIRSRFAALAAHVKEKCV